MLQGDAEALARAAVNLHELDLTGNLLHRWEFVGELTSVLPGLRVGELGSGRSLSRDALLAGWLAWASSTSLSSRPVGGTMHCAAAARKRAQAQALARADGMALNTWRMSSSCIPVGAELE